MTIVDMMGVPTRVGDTILTCSAESREIGRVLEIRELRNHKHIVAELNTDIDIGYIKPYVRLIYHKNFLNIMGIVEKHPEIFI